MLVLLPGMDGTGDLFSPFVEAFEGPTQVVRYPTSDSNGYSELEAVARTFLPASEPYFLLGESFSGPIAIALAASKPPNLLGVVLCCTFATNPRPALAPVRALVGFLPARPPLRMVEALLCGRLATPELRSALARALATLPPSTLRARVKSVLSLNVLSQLRAVSVPVLYLRAMSDRLVPRTASRLVIENAQNVQVVELAAPHFLLQTVPKQAAVAIAEFMRKVQSAL